MSQRQKNLTSAARRAAQRITEKNIRSIVDIEKAEHIHETVSDRIALTISRFCGSMIFVWVHVAWFAGWVALNTIWLDQPFDPFPFSLLTLVVSLEAIFLSTFIMIAENRQERVSERRNELDLQVNLLAEQEGTKTLQLLSAIAKKLGVDVAADLRLSALEQAAKPEELAREIDRLHEPRKGEGNHRR